MAELIRLLPDSVVNQIAAGEVIQRPASVVKELIDNALDSGASNIKLYIKEAGKEMIQIHDNGCGMSAIDARMSFERHATSKIRTSEDLFKIQTMGFRGEALASIAAVARVEMRSKRHEDETGTKILIQDSKIIKQEPCVCMNGTQIQVSDLFYSVPARKKFLKSDAVELRHIHDEFVAQALSHPEISMSFNNAENEVYKCSSEGLKQRIHAIFGKRYVENLIEIQQETDIVNIGGYIGNAEIMKKSRGEQFLYINRRLIKSNYLHHAISSSFEEVLAIPSQPFYVLFLNIDPTHIDINVHPTKHEIKFDDERLIYNFLKVAIKQALGKQLIAPALNFENASAGLDQLFQSHSNSRTDITTNSSGHSSSGGSQAHWKQLAFPSTSREKVNQREEEIFRGSLENNNNSSHLFSSDQKEIQTYQLYQTYIMYVSKAGISIIDQQSAHERILYEYYKKAITDHSGASQKLLFPQTIHLNKLDAQILTPLLNILHSIGIEIESFGSETFIIQAMPNMMDGKFVEKELIAKLIEHYKMNLEFSFSPSENLARSMSLSSSIKRGNSLTKEEMNQIVEQLFLCENPNISPSGKKCVYMIKIEDLSKIFN